MAEINMNLLRWLGAATGIIGALLFALNIEETRYGFFAFLFSALLYCYTHGVIGTIRCCRCRSPLSVLICWGFGAGFL